MKSSFEPMIVSPLSCKPAGPGRTVHHFAAQTSNMLIISHRQTKTCGSDETSHRNYPQDQVYTVPSPRQGPSRSSCRCIHSHVYLPVVRRLVPPPPHPLARRCQVNTLSLMQIKGRNMLQRTRGRLWQRAPTLRTPKHRRLDILDVMTPSSGQSVIQQLVTLRGARGQDILLTVVVVHTTGFACFVFPNVR